MEAHQLINQDSGLYEYYSPQEIVEAARQTMGFITLDPASSAIANGRVKASAYMDEIDDGLSKDWYGSVWMNHPYSRIGNKLWIEKLVSEYEKGNVKEACCITFAATSEKWFQPLLKRPQCYLSPRTNYYLPDGTKKRGVTKGSVVTYFGENVDKFYEAFKHLGEVKISYGT